MDKTIATATRCVRHLLSSEASLVTHPLPSNLSDFVITDGHWLLENLLCLLSNAIKYSYSGEINLTIELVQKGSEPSDATVVRLDDDGIPIPLSLDSSHDGIVTNTTMVLVIVEDEGVGVTPEVRSTLFQPFKQAQRLAGGTGACSYVEMLYIGLRIFYLPLPHLPQGFGLFSLCNRSDCVSTLIPHHPISLTLPHLPQGLGLFSLCKRVEALGGTCGCTGRSAMRMRKKFVVDQSTTMRIVTMFVVDQSTIRSIYTSNIPYQCPLS